MSNIIKVIKFCLSFCLYLFTLPADCVPHVVVVAGLVYVNDPWGYETPDQRTDTGVYTAHGR